MRHTAPALVACLLTATLATLATPALAARVIVIGTTDLHGHLDRTAALAGYLDVIRARAKEDGAAVLLVDGGDMFQGTLESNAEEGKTVVDAYNALGYDAVTIGNHEFDFGPAGPLPQPKTDADDAQGALKARAKQANFPFLGANILDEKTKKPVTWPNVKPSVLLEKQAGAVKVKIGVIGVTTIDTKFTTNAMNTRGLIIEPLRDAVLREADALKKRGADMLVLAAHAGGKCKDVHDANDLSSCEQDSEIVNLARSLPEGLIDVIVAGHTHNQMAHMVNGSAIVIGWANGKGFSRVDVDVDVQKHEAAVAKVHTPRPMCAEELAPLDACAPPPYEDYRVAVSAKIKKQIAPALAEATRVRERPLGLTIKHGVKRAYDDESALGNLFTDLMRESAVAVFHDRVDVALMNGGGIRADLPEGKLTYGAVFEMMPFDNRYAMLKLKGSELRKMLASNLSYRKGGIFSVSGVELLVTCEGPKASVEMKLNGKVVGDEDVVHVVTTDFLAGGGDGSLDGVKARPGAHQIDDGQPVREHLASAFVARAQKGQKVIDGKGPELFDPNRRRMKNSSAPGARCKKE